MLFEWNVNIQNSSLLEWWRLSWFLMKGLPQTHELLWNRILKMKWSHIWFFVWWASWTVLFDELLKTWGMLSGLGLDRKLESPARVFSEYITDMITELRMGTRYLIRWCKAFPRLGRSSTVIDETLILTHVRCEQCSFTMKIKRANSCWGLSVCDVLLCYKFLAWLWFTSLNNQMRNYLHFTDKETTVERPVTFYSQFALEEARIQSQVEPRASVTNYFVVSSWDSTLKQFVLYINIQFMFNNLHCL